MRLSARLSYMVRGMAATNTVPNAYPQITLLESDSCVSSAETPQGPLIQPTGSSQTSPSLPSPAHPCNVPSDIHTTILESSVIDILDTQDEQKQPSTDTMGESVYSYYSDSDVESPYSDAQSDIESIYEIQCEQARAVRFLHPGRPSIVDLMRADKPVFKRASKMIVRRPIERPFISPIQPPKNFQKSFRTSFSPVHHSSSDSEASSCDKESDKSSEPSTPILDDEDGSSTPTSDRSPSTPDTPRSSFEQEHRLPMKPSAAENENHSPSFKSKMSSRLRFLPKRSSSMNVDLESETLKQQPPRLPPLFTAESMRSRTNLAAIPASPIPVSPQHEPLTALHIPQRSIWRDAGKSRFLGHKIRRVDSRVGLQAH